LTYTVTLFGAGQAITLDDPVPDGTSYIQNSASVEPPVGTLTTSESQIAWTGTLSAEMSVEIRFQFLVETNATKVIKNVADLRVVDVAATHQLEASAIVNACRVYLPIILKP
jgi:hypothetical protein